MSEPGWGEGAPPVARRLGGKRGYTSKQMADACEMIVAAELTLAGVPAIKVADNWPDYDVIAQPLGLAPQRVSVKSRTFTRGASFIEYDTRNHFEWLALVLLQCEGASERRIFVIPRQVAESRARRNGPTTKSHQMRYWRVDEVATRFMEFENNFALRHAQG
ncbi:hypothetical protein [Roseomonas sp. AR75]|uniref:hypothetical protein n=1 Tax=Roseomonas sp. AR75 TaxID=2562311 RepID=UPI0010C0B5F9|nr:hypothetical protein [Roseomonas sp. AR75]